MAAPSLPAVATAMRLLVALALTACAGSSSSRGFVLPKDVPIHRLSELSLGQRLHGLPASSYRTLTSSGSFRPAHRIMVVNNVFEVGVNDRNEVVFVSPEDRDFETPEGIRVGDSFEKVATATDALPVREPGWALHVALPSGWRAAFVRGYTLTEGSSPEGLKVRFIFKRKGGG